MYCGSHRINLINLASTAPNNVLPLHLKQTFPPMIWIFTEDEGNPCYLLKSYDLPVCHLYSFESIVRYFGKNLWHLKIETAAHVRKRTWYKCISSSKIPPCNQSCNQISLIRWSQTIEIGFLYKFVQNCWYCFTVTGLGNQISKSLSEIQPISNM